MLSKNASDVFITTGFPPAFKVDGKVTPVSNQALTSVHTQELARAIIAHGESDPGGSELLNEYFSQRRLDRTATILFTDSLIRLFCKDIPLLNSARGFGLAALGAIPPAKNFLVRRMMFGARG